MSGRQKAQNKKRRSVQRDRTVTTLAADPDTQFLVPTPSDDSASPVSTFIPFSPSLPAHNSGAANGVAFHPASGFPMTPMTPSYTPFSPYQNANNSFAQPMHPFSPTTAPYYPSSVSSQHYPPTPKSTSGPQQPLSDLEKLENLKAAIKNEQHEYFRPIPKPSHLEGVWLGPRTPVTRSGASQVPPHPEQVPASIDSDQPSSFNANSQLHQRALRPTSSMASTVSMSSDAGRRPRDSKDLNDASEPRNPAPASSASSVISHSVPIIFQSSHSVKRN
jgi:hypothetical protein